MDVQRRLHRRRRDVERLEQEGLDDERDRQRCGDQDHPLDDQPLGPIPLRWLLVPTAATTIVVAGLRGGRRPPAARAPTPGGAIPRVAARRLAPPPPFRPSPRPPARAPNRPLL